MQSENQSKAPTSRKKRKVRPSYQKKPIHKGVKSLRGQPEIYDQIKKVVSIGITPKAVEGLDALSQIREISRSELIERIGRGLIQLADPSTVSP